MTDDSEVLKGILEKFIEHVDELSNEEDPAGNGFHREFRELRDLAMKQREEDTFPATEGRKPENFKKNRYKDILPFDARRVKLIEIPGERGSDYINASFISNAHGLDCYIATMGPLPGTVNDFWRMLWQYDVKVVIMACKEEEMGKKKCHRYWAEGDEETAFGDIKVSLYSEEQLADDCKVRDIKATKGKENRFIQQFHYTGWPDHGIPDDIDVILEMIAKMRQTKQNTASPVVVHCSAGCGRTGTVCAIDYAWDVLKTGKMDKNFSLYDIIKSMRQQRQSMIQTPDQYELAHLAVMELFKEHLKAMEDNVYANYSYQQQDDDEGTYTDVQNVADVKDGAVTDDTTYADPIPPPRHAKRRTSDTMQKEVKHTIDSLINRFDSPPYPVIVAQAQARPLLTKRPLNLSPIKQEDEKKFAFVEVEQQKVEEIHRGREVPNNVQDKGVQNYQNVKLEHKENETKLDIVPPTVKTSDTRQGVSGNTSSSVTPVVSVSPVSTASTAGLHRTIITVGGSVGASPNTVTSHPMPATQAQKSSGTGPGPAHAAVSNKGSPGPVSPGSGAAQLQRSGHVQTQSAPSGDMYAGVNRSNNKGPVKSVGHTTRHADEGAYDEVNFGARHSGQRPEPQSLVAPAIPFRGYQDDPVPSSSPVVSLNSDKLPSTSKSYTLDHESESPQDHSSSAKDKMREITGGIKKGFKNLIGGSRNPGESSSQQGSTTDHIPGYGQRISAPKGPRSPPADWSKQKGSR